MASISQSVSRILCEENPAFMLRDLGLSSVRLCWGCTGGKVEVKVGSGGIWADTWESADKVCGTELFAGSIVLQRCDIC